MTSASQGRSSRQLLCKNYWTSGRKRRCICSKAFSHPAPLSMRRMHHQIMISLDCVFNRVLSDALLYVCSSATQLLIWRNAAIRRMPPRWISTVHHHQTKNNQQDPTWIDSIPSSPLACSLAPKFEDYCILSNQQINRRRREKTNHSRSSSHDLEKFRTHCSISLV